MKDQLVLISKNFTQRAYALLIVFIVIRIGEHLCINLFHDFSVKIYHQLIFSSLYFDIFFTLHLISIILPIYFFIGYFNIKAANYSFMILSIGALLINFLLIKYFFSTLTLLDNAVFRIPFKELFFIMGTEVTFSSIYFYLIIASIIGSIYVLYYLSRKKMHGKLLQVTIYSLLFLATIFSSFNYFPKNSYNDSLSHDIASNKLIFLIRNTMESERLEKELGDFSKIENSIKIYQKIHQDLKFTLPEYPLIHQRKDKNILGNWFELDQNAKPNIVIVFAESLSRTFSGPNARFGSFTPFIDSLSENSIYFEHFLSNADRTFGVFPNVLASLPNANSKGIISLGNNIPKHQSLISILNKNGYTSSFFFGGWGNFDQMKTYFSNQKTNHIFTESDFPSNYKKYVKWGFSDEDLYKRSLELMTKHDVKTPYINIYMTTSLHTPWIIPGNKDEYFTNLYNQALTKQGKKHTGFYNAYEPQLKCAIYADNALRRFFNDYKKRPEYSNTVFVIVGDHNIRAMQPKHALEFYHVPLLIFSPMLKKSSRVSALSTHRDITPSILSLLDNQYHLNYSKNVHWLSNGLDLQKEFRCNKTTTLATLAGEIGYLENEFLLINDDLYQMQPGFELVKIEDVSKKFEMKENFDTHRKLSRYVITTNRISPPEKVAN